MGEHKNNFDAIRHLAAIMVLWAHSFSLAKNGRDPLAALIPMGAFGVNIFFVISGYLISKSWIDRRNAWIFIEARVLRIIPGLVVSVVICAFLVGPAMTELSLGAYFHDWRLRWFVVGNISMLAQIEELPGLFAHNPHPNVVNGSLWTLPREVKMYAVVFLLGVLARKRRPELVFLVGFSLIFFSASWVFVGSGQSETALTIARLGRYFSAGVIYYCLEKLWGRKRWFTPTAIGVLGIALLGSHYQSLFLPAFLVVLVLAVATEMRLPAIGGRWSNDLSYGLYIFGYPVQQVIMGSVPGMNGYSLFAVSLIITAAVAWASWHFVERPALGLKGRFPDPFGFLRRASNSAPCQSNDQTWRSG